MTRRLLDELLMLDPKHRAPESSLARYLDQATFINADNVSKYYYEIESRTLTPNDVPNIAPPFENLFIEYEGPRVINEDGRMLQCGADGRFFKYYGNHFVTWEIGDRNKEVEESIRDDLDIRWCSIVSSYFMNKKGELASHPYEMAIRLYINSDGSFNSSFISFPTHIDQSHLDKEFINKIATDMLQTLVVDFLTISFMHCKNVELVKSPELKRTKKRRDHPRVRYYTLNIHPMRKILDSQGGAQKTGIKLALHICRGHFKDFSNGEGLFGKHKGLYWWDSQVRGNVKNGVVTKDYSIGIGI